MPKQRLDLAAEQYDQASEAVRSFVGYIEERSSDLKLAIPFIPDGANVDEEDKAMVAAEQQRTAETYTALQRRMTGSPTRWYLADRCCTRAVVAGSKSAEAGPVPRACRRSPTPCPVSRKCRASVISTRRVRARQPCRGHQPV